VPFRFVGFFEGQNAILDQDILFGMVQVYVSGPDPGFAAGLDDMKAGLLLEQIDRC
jgi:hypothetical protein